MASPLIILIISAVIAGALSTIMILIPVSVQHWQSYWYDETKLIELNSTTDYTVYKLSSDKQFFEAVKNPGVSNATATSYFLYDLQNGLWTICDKLNDTERALVSSGYITKANGCYTFVLDFNEDAIPEENKKAKQLGRLQNSVASCYVVVLIDLASAIVVGAFGIFQKQVASCMVTGVLYLMASLFSTFGLAMFHTKMYYEQNNCYSMDVIPDKLCEARHVTLLYAAPLAWLGAIMCAFASTLWLIVARALRVIKAKTML